MPLPTNPPSNTNNLTLQIELVVYEICLLFICGINKLRTGDAELRFYITTVQDG